MKSNLLFIKSAIRPQQVCHPCGTKVLEAMSFQAGDCRGWNLWLLKPFLKYFHF